MFRDRRVRSSAFFGPFFLVFVLMLLFGSLAKSISRPGGVRLHVVAEGADNPIVEAMKQRQMRIVEVSSLDEGRRLVRDGKAALVLRFPADLATRMAQGRQGSIEAVFDSKEQRSQIALSLVERIAQETNKRAVERLLSERGISNELASPLAVKATDVTRAKGASDLLTGILPYLIVIWAFFGGMSTASDIVAGEKERTTLETLLISPVARTQIVFGKFLALGLICLLSSLSSLVAVMLIAALRLPATEALFKDGLGISPMALATTIAVLLPTVALFASVLIAISSFAKNTREAQTYLGLASFIVIMPAMFSQFIGFTDYASARWVSLVPVLNTANSIRSSLLGKLDGVSFALTILVGVVLAAVALAIATKLFNREQVLTRV